MGVFYVIHQTPLDCYRCYLTSPFGVLQIQNMIVQYYLSKSIVYFVSHCVLLLVCVFLSARARKQVEVVTLRMYLSMHCRNKMKFIDTNVCSIARHVTPL